MFDTTIIVELTNGYLERFVIRHFKFCSFVAIALKSHYLIHSIIWLILSQKWWWTIIILGTCSIL